MLSTAQSFATNPKSSFVQNLEHWSGQSAQTVTFGTNAPVYGRDVARAVIIMGPGSIEQAHAVDEWIDVHALVAMTRVLRQWWGVSCGA